MTYRDFFIDYINKKLTYIIITDYNSTDLVTVDHLKNNDYVNCSSSNNYGSVNLDRIIQTDIEDIASYSTYPIILDIINEYQIYLIRLRNNKIEHFLQ